MPSVKSICRLSARMTARIDLDGKTIISMEQPDGENMEKSKADGMKKLTVRIDSELLLAFIKKECILTGESQQAFIARLIDKHRDHSTPKSPYQNAVKVKGPFEA